MAATKAATTEEPIAKISAGAIRSKKFAIDMTHTFELEPSGEQGDCYLSSVKIPHI